jgi:hypothetical protein
VGAEEFRQQVVLQAYRLKLDCCQTWQTLPCGGRRRRKAPTCCIIFHIP